jgi:hypothetical protein
MAVKDTTANWSYTTATIRQANAATGNKVEYVTGNASTEINATVYSEAFISATSARSATGGVGIDSTTTLSGLVGSAYSTAGNSAIPIIGRYSGAPGLGYHFISWNESGSDGSIGLFLGNNGGNDQTGMIVNGQF